MYDLKPWFDRNLLFNKLKENNHYLDVRVDIGGYGIIWDDELDLECEELFYQGKLIKKSF